MVEMEDAVKSDFINKFKIATGFTPFPYQIEFALSQELPEILNIPTGCGKTDTIIFGWIWRRLFSTNEIKKSTPRRLVYCLPTRVLVEQVKQNAKEIIKNLGLNNQISVNILIGGDTDDEWEYHPEKEAIIIGTQDMLISRALNRGYGMSKFKWSIHYAFLNNDSFWAIDEMQLMGVGLETTAQLQAFRDEFGCYGNSITLWASATTYKNRIETIDYKNKMKEYELKLSDNDLKCDVINKVVNASKKVEYIRDETFYKDYYKNFADKLIEFSKKFEGKQDNVLIIGILNTVDRAKKIYEELCKNDSDFEKILLHSQFREIDKQNNLKLLIEKNNKKIKILVSTQVIEAGVDISGAVLITELAPISSLIQRFGRCNRKGEFEESKIYLTNPLLIKDSKDKDNNKKDNKNSIKIDNNKNALPYLLSQIEESDNKFMKIEDAKIKNLYEINDNINNEIYPVIRKKDFIDLFDTTSDLNGKDIDISKYIRDDLDNYVQVFWRDDTKRLIENNPNKKSINPSREEFCKVPINEIKKLLTKEKSEKSNIMNIYKWNYVNGNFEKLKDNDNVIPGQIFMLDTKAGMYNSRIGWTGKNDGNKVETVIKNEKSDDKNSPFDSIASDKYSYNINKNIELVEHLNDVKNKAIEISEELDLGKDITEILATAALWHDVGKAHFVFQEKLRANNPDLPKDKIWAKSIKKDNNNSNIKNERKYFRHELASTLAWLSINENSKNSILIAYLIATHHGKINMIIRSFPDNEYITKEHDKLIALGIKDGDRIGPLDGLLKESINLNLSNLMYLGENSWLNNIIKLRDDKDLGPLRLAYYSSIVRIADWIASDNENKITN